MTIINAFVLKINILITMQINKVSIYVKNVFLEQDIYYRTILDVYQICKMIHGILFE